MLRTSTNNRKQSRTKAIAGYGFKTILAGLLVGGTIATVSCDSPTSREDLNPEGPPMIRQIMINESTIAMNGATQKSDNQLAFGTHASTLFRDDDGLVETATIKGNQEVRIVLDEQIRGNSLEEISCANGSFSRIPDGTTPDDINDCSGPIDSLQNCKIDLCLDTDPSSPTFGKPVGVELVENQNGTGDRFTLRMIDFDPDPAEDAVELGAQIVCDGVAVRMDPTLSFWNPSGNQTISSNPALGKKGLGPVIVLKTIAGVGLPASQNCTIQFHPDVVDHDGNQICAPEGGLVDNGCTAGDTSRVAFGTQAIAIDDVDIEDGSMNVSVDESGFFGVYFNANMDSSTLAAVTLTANGAPVLTPPAIQDDDKTTMLFSLPDPFLPNATYVLTVGTGLHDQYGQGLTQDAVITWTTGDAAVIPPDASVMIDAGAPDA